MYNSLGLPKKHAWYFPNTPHNLFTLQYMLGQNPYKRWHISQEEANELHSHRIKRSLRSHQVDMFCFGWHRKHAGFAAEMGLGKSLVAIELIENMVKEFPMTQNEIWYVGPRSAKKSFELEIQKWNSPIYFCERLTYEALTSKLSKWVDGMKPPRVVIFDESSRLKNIKSKRSQAARHLVTAMREEYGFDSLIIEMSGTPAPNSPEDWHSQATLLRPGYLAEATVEQLSNRLQIKRLEESPITGQSFYKPVTYLDNELKCKHCGGLAEEHISDKPFKPHTRPDGTPATPFNTPHAFEPSINEVAKLRRRLSGLFLVKMAEDCLDLPPIQYRTVRVMPTPEIVQATKLVKQVCKNASQARAKMLQLADGFNYTTTTTSTTTCILCNGTGHYHTFVEPDDFDPMAPPTYENLEWQECETECPNCGGEGVVPKYERTLQQVHCPKDDVLLDELDAHQDIGRFVVFGAFTGSLEKIQEICLSKHWVVLRMDGTGWKGFGPEDHYDTDELIQAMDYSHPNYADLYRKYPKIVVVANAKSASMGLTFTASPSILFYSNSYDAEARAQAEKRIHRLGGRPIPVTIIDIVHLAIDKLVRDKLIQKQDLQDLTLKELFDELEETEKQL